MSTSSSTTTFEIAFIGGGNMATAIIGGLLRQGRAASSIRPAPPGEDNAHRWRQRWGGNALPPPDATRATAGPVVGAGKPRQLREAAAACAPHTAQALHYSVMAGLRTDDMARLLGTPRVVRAMPNTPALVGQGITGLFARPEVSQAEQQSVQDMVEPTGQWLWVKQEGDLDAVTALSGSGPAYVFYFIEAMVQAASDMGLDAEQGRALALATFAGATTLAAQSTEAPSGLRRRVTAKGGTTHAAPSSLEASGGKVAFGSAIRAAQRRAGELGDEFGR